MKNDVSLTCLIIIITLYVKFSEKMGVNVMFVTGTVLVFKVSANVMKIGLLTAYVNV